MEVKYRGKKIEIPEIIYCNKDDGVMLYSSEKKAYVCVNVEGCNNEISIKDYIKSEKALSKIMNSKKEKEFDM